MNRTTTSILTTAFWLTCGLVNAQSLIFTETMGDATGAPAGSNTAVSTWETNNYFDNDGYAMSGNTGTNNADIRNNGSNSPVPAYSGGNHLWLAKFTNSFFQIANITNPNYSNLFISFAARKNETSSSAVTVEWRSSNSGAWNSLGTYGASAGTSSWATYTTGQFNPGNVTTLQIRIKGDNLSGWRLDDIKLLGTAPCSTPTISAIASTAPNATLCESNGNAVTNLSANVSGNGTYSYQWQYQDNNGNWENITGSVSASGSATAPFSVSQNASPSDDRQYRVIVSQGTCSASAVQLVTVIDDPVLTLSSTNITCFGDNDGTAAGALTGGTSGNSYTFEWSGSPNGDGTLNVTDLGPGTYTLDVTGLWGCNASGSVTITEPTKVNISASNTSIACNGGTSDVTINTWGGTTPYAQNEAGSYTVSAGSYTYYVQDANGCQASTTLDITEPALLVASSSAPDILCNGGSTDVTVSATGGTAPYTGDGVFNVTAGSYDYTITDNNGCAAVTSINVTEPALLTIGLVASDYNGYGVSCFESTDGSVNATANGGTGAYSYSWSNGSTSEDLSGLAAGSYSVTVTDANGCTASADATLNEPSKVNISVTNTTILCNGQTSDVTVTSWGGVTPYSVNEAGSYTVPAGTYTYDVVDANGCAASTTIDITQPALLTVDAGADETVFLGYGPMQCADLNATVNGGTPAYSVVWTSTASGGGMGTSLTACPVGNETYTVSVVDANGCTASDELSICVVDVTCYAGNSSIQKVEMCQVPPGNPANAHTICISPSAVPAHLAIGCQLGACGELAAACSGPAAKSMEAEVLAAALTAYPNPTENTTTISVTLTKGGNYSVEMFDMMGKLVKTVYAGSFEDYENLEFDVDMTNLNTGVYMISVSNGDQKIENIRVMKN